ncbi:hypothetical protein AB0P21_09825 [Kribbella sp. NPDC056861]|uniref:hypothetical protein n=1 Tax=Kribbella sp. NPDC056861 TaxID=3154857 RepID=UPI00342AE8DA
MGSRGIGDVRRVLGDRQPQGWIDLHFSRPAPALPDIRGDALFSFVAHQLTGRENQVAIESREYQDGAHGAAFLRWALDMRRQCDAIRHILVRYGEAHDSDSPDLSCLRQTLKDLAGSWSNEYGWRESWDDA